MAFIPRTRTSADGRLMSDFLPTREVGIGGAMGATFGQDFTTDLLVRSARVRKASGIGEAIDPETLNRENADLGLTFDRPRTQGEVAELRQGLIKQRKLDRIASMGPQGLAMLPAHLLAGIAGSALDPLDFASMFVPIVGPAGRARLATKLGGVRRARVAEGAIEGGVGTLLTEPLFYAYSQEQQLDYTMNDALFTVGIGAVLGAGIGGVRNLVNRRADRDEAAMRHAEQEAAAIARGDVRPSDLRIQALPEKTRRQIAWRLAMGQMSEGRAIDLQGIVRPEEIDTRAMTEIQAQRPRIVQQLQQAGRAPEVARAEAEVLVGVQSALLSIYPEMDLARVRQALPDALQIRSYGERQFIQRAAAEDLPVTVGEVDLRARFREGGEEAVREALDAATPEQIREAFRAGVGAIDAAPSAPPAVESARSFVTPEMRDAFEERAAIMQFDGGMTREAAEAAAAQELGFTSRAEMDRLSSPAPVGADRGGRQFQTADDPNARREAADVADVRDAEGRLLAPNGKPSVLPEHLWRLVRTPTFKRWFGDWEADPQNASKVVDENGEPMPVYHAMSSEFDAFDFHRGEFGMHFGTREQADDVLNRRREGRVQGFFLSIKNPVEMQDRLFWETSAIADHLGWRYGAETFKEREFVKAKAAEQGVDLDLSEQYRDYSWDPESGRKALKVFGHDGVAYENRWEGEGQKSWIAIEPNQIKSTLNVGAFSDADPRFQFQQRAAEASPDLPFQAVERTESVDAQQRARVAALVDQMNDPLREDQLPRARDAQVKSAAFKNWFGDWESDPEGASKAVDDQGRPKVFLHLTKADFEAFDPGRFNQTEGWGDVVGHGFYFSDVRAGDEPLQGYAGATGSTIPVYLNMRNPLVLRTDQDYFDWAIAMSGGKRPDGIKSLKDYQDFFVKHYKGEKPGELNEPLASVEAAIHGHNRLPNAERRRRFEAMGYDGVLHYNERGRLYQAIVLEPTQIKSAISNRGTFDPSDPRFQFQQVEEAPDPLPGFTMRSRAAVNAANRADAQPQGWRNIFTRAGVTADELNWLGWDAFAARYGEQQKIPRADVEAWIDENTPQLEERTLGGESGVSIVAEKKLDEDSFRLEFSDAQGRRTSAVITDGHNVWKVTYIDFSGTEHFKRFESKSQARHAAQGMANRDLAGDRQSRFGDYAVAGGKNYRELLIRDPSLEGSYKSPHFGDQEIVHLRMDDREVSGVGRTLFVNEIQSDLHQKGRLYGYRDKDHLEQALTLNNKLVQERRKADAADARKQTILKSATRSFVQLAGIEEESVHAEDFYNYALRHASSKGDAVVKMQFVNYRDHGEQVIASMKETGGMDALKAAEAEIEQSYGRIREIESQVSRLGRATPLAPLADGRSTELAMKVALRKAALEGYDAVAFARADQIARAVGGSADDLAVQYDQKMPAFLAKYVKPWGSKVETVDVVEGNPLVRITPEMRESLETKPQFLFQQSDAPLSRQRDVLQAAARSDGTPAGFFDQSSGEIGLFQAARPDTVLHEAGHYLVRLMGLAAEQADAPPRIREDMATLLAWVSDQTGQPVRSWRDLQPIHHEKLADGFVQFHREGGGMGGGAMARVWEFFREVLRNLARTANQMGIQLSPAARDVFQTYASPTTDLQRILRDAGVDPVRAAADNARAARAEMGRVENVGRAATASERPQGDAPQVDLSPEAAARVAELRADRERIEAALPDDLPDEMREALQAAVRLEGYASEVVTEIGGARLALERGETLSAVEARLVEAGVEPEDVARIVDAFDGLAERGEPVAPREGLQFQNVDPENAPLFAVHNLSEENLRHADELGGLPAPSLAIMRGDIGFDNFGDITLVGDPRRFADPRARGVRAFNADIYSPRQPRAQHDLTSAGWRKLTDTLRPVAAELDTPLSNTDIHERISYEGLSALEDNDAARLAFLRHIGDAPRIRMKKNKPVDPGLRKWVGKKRFEISEDPEFKAALTQSIEQQISLLPEDSQSDVREVLLPDGSPSFRDIENRARDLANYRESELDRVETRKAIRERLEKTTARMDEFRQWLDQEFGSVLGRKFFTDKQGRKKPYDLSRLTREMKRGLRDGEGFTYGIGSIRSHVAREFRSLKEIKESRSSVVTKEQMEAVKAEADAEFQRLADSFAPYRNFKSAYNWLNTFSEFLKDLAKGRLREWQTSIFTEPVPDDLLNEARAFLRSLRDMPTEYFEMKAQRSVGINEFSVAIVPQSASAQTLQRLKAAGLRVVQYDQTDPKGRLKALREIGDPSLQFQNAGQSTFAGGRQPFEVRRPRYASIADAAQALIDDTMETLEVERRNAVINAQRSAHLMSMMSQAFAIHGDAALGLEAALTGTVKRLPGGRRSADAQGAQWAHVFTQGLYSEMEAVPGLLSWASRPQNQRAIAVELEALQREGDAPRSERMPGDVEGEAQIAARMINDYLEARRKTANRFGAWIRPLPGRIARQTHDSAKLRSAGFETWARFVEERVDWNRTNTNGMDRRDWLQQFYNNVMTGIHDSGPSDLSAALRGPANLARSLSEHRVMHFKGAEEWMAYNERFGAMNFFESVFNELDQGGRQIGLMQIFGTNPTAMMEMTAGQMQRRLRDAGAPQGRIDDLRGGHLMSRMMELDGRANSVAPGRASEIWATAMSTLRFMQSTAKLGGAVLSAPADVAMTAMTISRQGVPALRAMLGGFGAVYEGFVTRASMGRAEQRQLAEVIGVGAGGMMTDLANRFEFGGDYTRWQRGAMNWFFKKTLLTQWTNAVKRGFGLMFAREIGMNARRNWSALNPKFRSLLEQYDLTEADWQTIGVRGISRIGGADYFDPRQLLIAARSADPEEAIRLQDLAMKTSAMIQEQADFASPSPGASERAILRRGTQRGTVAGEAIRLMTQFKAFPITVMNRPIGQLIYGRGATSFAAGFFDPQNMAHFATYLAIGVGLGGLSLLLKDLAKGREPRDVFNDETMTGIDGKFALAALVQSGGLGIYADFLFAQRNRFGNTALETIAGPSLGAASDLVGLVQASVHGGFVDDTEAPGYGEVINLIKGNTPFANVFYVKAALDYAIVYQLQEMANPGYLARMERRMKKLSNQEFLLTPPSQAIPRGGRTRPLEGILPN